MYISKFQYITNYQSETSHLNQVKQVVKAGVNWVQYRPKNYDEETILVEGLEIAKFCKEEGFVFIMNDSVDFAVKLNADGVHLGKNDMSPLEARKVLGNTKIIGGTANTNKDIQDLVAQGVNYIGLGPYRFTKTKKKLSPVLGLNGYIEILNLLRKQGISIPIVAIGGIKELDTELLKNTGVHGVAVSSILSEAINITLKTKELLNIF